MEPRLQDREHAAHLEKLVKFWPYWSCLVLCVLTFSYISGLNWYQAHEAAVHATRYSNPATGGWRKDYDWQAVNRRNAWLDRMRYVLMVLASLHTLVNVTYAFWCMTQDRRHAIALIFFAIAALMWAGLWATVALARSIGSGRMVG